MDSLLLQARPHNRLVARPRSSQAPGRNSPYPTVQTPPQRTGLNIVVLDPAPAAPTLERAAHGIREAIW